MPVPIYRLGLRASVSRFSGGVSILGRFRASQLSGLAACVED